ncbi:hypothetical protein FHP29_10435 [Nocardioides albidus]|uniref:Lipoprotein LpqN n=1 Tax=Nocardioides albidus TaxID=1517589 RepID=A0A5C4VZC3_9ACTN|nr:hypothetical protein [Nocardioides albidus]TNM40459.1 hypothetical protein FHP29_10435 [Nocardioides albidus]
MADRAGRMALLAALVVVPPLAGCQSDPATPEQPERTGASASATPTTASSSAPTQADPSTVPATGPGVDTALLSYRLPAASWTATSASGDRARYIETPQIWLLRETEQELTTVEGKSLDTAARVSGVGDPSVMDPPFERGENRTVDGVEGFTASTTRVVAGTPELNASVLLWGALVEGHYVFFELSGPKADPRTQDWFDAVLASVTWK